MGAAIPVARAVAVAVPIAAVVAVPIAAVVAVPIAAVVTVPIAALFTARAPTALAWTVVVPTAAAPAALARTVVVTASTARAAGPIVGRDHIVRPGAYEAMSRSRSRGRLCGRNGRQPHRTSQRAGTDRTSCRVTDRLHRDQHMKLLSSPFKTLHCHF
ncbi:hypothetical protein AWB92_22855 [Mycobacterium sp. IEC1808]|nr:hypothetical protein AWB92_22855 [Mycobacterium sp. IEC1808]